MTPAPSARPNDPAGIGGFLPDRRLVFLTIGVLLALRLCFDIFAAPLPDEAYYWLWGQHPALSYFDHPPLHAWLQGLVGALAGWNRLGLRLATWLTTAGTLVIIWQRTKPGTAFAAAGPWPTIALFFASPVIFIFSAMTFPDHLVIFLVLLSAHWFALYFESLDTPKPRTAFLYLGAIALGLGGLTKYNMLFVGLGIVAAVLTTPKYRRLLANPHLYLAAVVSILMQAPVLYWNADNGLSSFQYNLSDRLDWAGAKGILTLTLFLVLSAAMLGPALVAPLLRFLAVPWRRADKVPDWNILGFWSFAPATAAFAGFCLVTPVQYYWNIIAYPIFLIAAFLFLRSRRAVAAHLIYGMVCAALFTANYTIVPLSALVGAADRESALMYGWDEVAARVIAARATTGADFVAASDYRTAAQLAFAMRDPSVESISKRKDQFDFWLDRGKRTGTKAVILTDDWHPLNDRIRSSFVALDLVEAFPVMRFGKRLKEYQLYLGTSFIGEPSSRKRDRRKSD